MNIFDFFTQEQLDDLPSDPKLGFAEFVRLAQAKLAERTRSLDSNDQDGWQEIEDARHGFMNVTLAAAKRFEIEPFCSMEVPTLEKFSTADHRQFKADLDHYMTQLVLDNSFRGRRETVPIPEKSKDRIRGHLNALRDCLNNANLTDAKRSKLEEKLAEFEKELEKQRVNLVAVMLVSFEILALPGAVWQSIELGLDTTNRLVTGIMQIVAEAKVEDEESRSLPLIAEVKALSPPRKTPLEPPKQSFLSKGLVTSYSNISDDIPF